MSEKAHSTFEEWYESESLPTDEEYAIRLAERAWQAARRSQPEGWVNVPAGFFLVSSGFLLEIAKDFDEASSDIESWGNYADEYFQKRWSLDSDIEQYKNKAKELRAMIEAAPQPPGEAE